MHRCFSLYILKVRFNDSKTLVSSALIAVVRRLFAVLLPRQEHLLVQTLCADRHFDVSVVHFARHVVSWWRSLTHYRRFVDALASGPSAFIGF